MASFLKTHTVHGCVIAMTVFVLQGVPTCTATSELYENAFLCSYSN